MRIGQHGHGRPEDQLLLYALFGKPFIPIPLLPAYIEVETQRYSHIKEGVASVFHIAAQNQCGRDHAESSCKIARRIVLKLPRGKRDKKYSGRGKKLTKQQEPALAPGHYPVPSRGYQGEKRKICDLHRQKIHKDIFKRIGLGDKAHLRHLVSRKGLSA